MTTISEEAWGIIPARGGSKSIPGKNLVKLAGVALIDYVANAGRESRTLSRLICSTEDERISEHVKGLGVEVDARPRGLAGDDTPVAAVISNLLDRIRLRGEMLPELIVLLQPTSPFLLPEHIDRLVSAVRAAPEAGSGQTIVSCPHNAHAVNQRRFDDDSVTFVFDAERKIAYNKQKKARHYLFGNLVATRTKSLLATNNLFAPPSVAIILPRIFGFDLDDGEDLAVANALVAAGIVGLPPSQLDRNGR